MNNKDNKTELPDMNCFDKIRLLNTKRCNEEGCNEPCTKIIKSSPNDKFYCTKHFKQKIKNGELRSLETHSIRFAFAKLLVGIGLIKVKEIG